MMAPFSKHTFRVGLILVLAFLLGGCAAHYGIKGHRDHSTQKLPALSQYSLLTLEVGETLRAVTPAKGMLVGGFWLAFTIEDQTIARALPRKVSFFKGTDIKALRVGKTKAYYGNAVTMLGEHALEQSQHGDWFGIEVVAKKSTG